MTRKRWMEIGMMTALMGAALFRFFRIVLQDRVPPVHDPLGLRHLSNLLYYSITRAGVSFDDFLSAASHNIYPPLIHYTALPFIALLGPVNGPAASMSFYLCVLVLSTFGIARHVAGPRAGLAASVFVLLTPHIDSFSRIYMADFPLTALVAMTVYLLMKTDGFSRRSIVIFLGLVVCIGMFTKQTFLIFAGFPIVFVAVASLTRAKAKSRKQVIWNLVIFSLLASAIPILYYLPNLMTFVSERDQVNAFFDRIDPQPYNIFTYLLILVTVSLGPILSMGALLGLAQNIKRVNYCTLFFWAIPALAVLNFIHPHISARHMLPVLPAFAVFFAKGLERPLSTLPAVSARRFFAATLALVAFSFLVTNVFNLGNRDFSFEDFHKRFQETGLLRPEKISWDVQKATDTIATNRNFGKVALLLNSPYTEALKGALWLRHPLANLDPLVERFSTGLVPEELRSTTQIEKYFEDVHWVLFHELYKVDSRYVNYSNPVDEGLLRAVFDEFFLIKDQFVLAGKYPYPEGGGSVLLYHRISPPINNLDANTNWENLSDAQTTASPLSKMN